MKKSLVALSSILLLPTLAYGGVVMDMVTRNAAGQETDRTRIYAQSKMIRMEQVVEDEAEPENTMIFLGNEFLYVNHEDESYIVMDESMIDDVSAQISDAMKEMEAELANMPPEQRAMVEQMMKGRMQGMMGQQKAPSAGPRIESVGSGKWNSYKCREYAVFIGPEKTQDICAADLDDVDGADEVIEAFRGMAAYMQKMTESMPMMPEDQMNPGKLMSEIDGFPVHTVDYKNGEVTGDVSLDSVTEKNLEPDMFAAPDGYRRENPFR